MAVPPDNEQRHAGLTAAEYEACAGRLRAEPPAVRFHGEPLGTGPTSPSDPAYSLWLHRDDMGASVTFLLMETLR